MRKFLCGMKFMRIFVLLFFNGWYTGNVARILIIINIVIAIDTFVVVDVDMIVVHVKL